MRDLWLAAQEAANPLLHGMIRLRDSLQRELACGQPAYFVRDEWVRERYEHQHPGWNRGRHQGWDKHDGGGHDNHGPGHGKPGPD